MTMVQKDRITRRSFLKILAISGAALGSSVLAGKAGLKYLLAENGQYIHRSSHVLMGTVLNFTLVSADKQQAELAINATIDSMRDLVSVFDHRDPVSALSILNRSGSLYDPRPELLTLLSQSREVTRASDGAFDVTVKPLIDAYRSTPTGVLPDQIDIATAIGKIGSENIHLTDDHISLEYSGMAITLDGIAKGAVIDGGFSELKKFGFDNIIVEAGGDLTAAGFSGPNMPWRIALRSPRAEAGFAMPTLKLTDMAVATSGDYMQPFSDDLLEHHIIDPRSGISSPELCSVSVIAPTAVMADALSTAVMASGKKAGLQLLKKFPGCEALLVDKQLNALTTPGFDYYVI